MEGTDVGDVARTIYLEYRKGIVVLEAYLTFVCLLNLRSVLPLVVQGTGLISQNDGFIIGWMHIFCRGLHG